jgi:hypothetical protein
MGLLDDGDLDEIFIQRMIFHVVGPADDDFQLMDEVDASGFESFFLARIRETNVGNRFNFIGEEAGVCPSLRSVSDDGGKFVQRSKELTELFQNGHKGAPQSSRGAFIVVSGHAFWQFLQSARTDAASIGSTISVTDSDPSDDYELLEDEIDDFSSRTFSIRIVGAWFSGVVFVISGAARSGSASLRFMPAPRQHLRTRHRCARRSAL